MTREETEALIIASIERAKWEAWEHMERYREEAEARAQEEQAFHAMLHDPTSDFYYADGAAEMRRDAGLE